MDGLAVTTVEGIGSTKTTLHPVQVHIFKRIIFKNNIRSKNISYQKPVTRSMQLPSSAFASPFFKQRIGQGYFFPTKMKGPLRMCVHPLFDNDKKKGKYTVFTSPFLC